MTEKYLDFAKITLSTYNLDGFDIDEQTALNSICNDINETLLDLNNEKTKLARFKHFNIPKIEPEDYKEHIISLDNDRKVICGIRHSGGNREMPFVNIETNFKSSKKELVQIYEKHLEKHFQKFTPNFLRYYTKDKSSKNINSSCYLIQEASIIKNKKPYIEEKTIELVQPKPDSYYDWYRKGYQTFHENFPELKANVQVNSKKSMDNCLKDGLLKIAKYNGERIGLIAADSSPFLGTPGIYFIEIFIAQKWRGKGLAKSLQRKFIDSVSTGNEIIWGTIDYQNKPSYKTALSNNRVPVRFENFAPLK